MNENERSQLLIVISNLRHTLEAHIKMFADREATSFPCKPATRHLRVAADLLTQAIAAINRATDC